MNIKNHLLIYFYLIFFLLNIKIVSLVKFSFDSNIIESVFKEILISDLIILFLSLIFFKRIIITIKKNLRNFYVKKFFLIILVGIIGVFFSYIINTNKISNSFFISLFYLNLFKTFISLIMFIILIEKCNFKITNTFLLSLTIFLLVLVLFNLWSQGHYSRLYYPFTSKTNGYNLLGYLTGILFFIGFNHNDKEPKKNDYLINNFNLIVLFLILFLTYSKATIISFIIVFVFYFILLKKNLSKLHLYFFLIVLLSVTLILDIIKYNYFGNVFSFLDIFLKPVSWFKEYNSFYYRIEHVWLGTFHQDLGLISFLFGEGIHSPKTHDSLYFTIISRFGFLGLSIFLYTIYVLFKSLNFKTHSVLSFILITGLTSEMILQSNIINPLAISLIYLNFKKN